jgi:regulator of protease activity HflC (stomatin/prohibitin superfamily)
VGYEKQKIPATEARAYRDVKEAESYTARQKKVAPARGARFEKQFAAYLKAPDVFIHRKRLSAMEEALADRRKLIRADWMQNVDEVFNVDLQETITPGFGIGEEDLITTEEAKDR